MSKFSQLTDNQLFEAYLEFIDEARQAEPRQRLLILEMADPLRRALMRRARSARS